MAESVFWLLTFAVNWFAGFARIVRIALRLITEQHTRLVTRDKARLDLVFSVSQALRIALQLVAEVEADKLVQPRRLRSISCAWYVCTISSVHVGRTSRYRAFWYSATFASVACVKSFISGPARS
jgi:hypothetical protein